MRAFAVQKWMVLSKLSVITTTNKTSPIGKLAKIRENSLNWAANVCFLPTDRLPIALLCIESLHLTLPG